MHGVAAQCHGQAQRGHAERRPEHLCPRLWDGHATHPARGLSWLGRVAKNSEAVQNGV